MKHYVYKLEDKDTKEFYYGSRTCKCEINEDDYMGSMKTWNPNKDNLIKTIIKSDFETRDEATEYEKEIVTEHYKNELNKNYSIPNTGFYSGGEPETNPNYGKLWDDKSKQKHSKVMEEYYKTHKAPNTDRKFSKEWRDKISKTRIKKGLAKGENNGMFGKEHSVVGLKNISEGCKNQPKYKCTHCGKETTAGNLKRWHNDNCKKNKKRKFEIL